MFGEAAQLKSDPEEQELLQNEFKPMQRRKAAASPFSAHLRPDPSPRPAVVQAQAREDGVELDSLGSAITELRSISSRLTALSEDLSSAEQINEYIVELEEIHRGANDELKTEIAVALEEELAEKLRALEAVESTAPRESETTEGPIQGVWGAGIIYGLVFGYPKTSLAVVAVLGVLERVIAQRKRKKLPPKKVSRTLFSEDRQAYYAMTRKKLQELSASQNLDRHDQDLIQQVVTQAINRARDENNFLGSTLPGQLNGQIGNFHNPAVANFMGFLDPNFVTPLLTDIDTVANKNIATPSVPSAERANFSLALRKMPFVKALYSGRIEGNIRKKSRDFANVPGKAMWKDRTSITTKITEVDDVLTRLTADRSQIDNGAFKKTLTEADRFVRQLVEPAMLARIDAPEVHVHLRDRQVHVQVLQQRIDGGDVEERRIPIQSRQVQAVDRARSPASRRHPPPAASPRARSHQPTQPIPPVPARLR